MRSAARSADPVSSLATICSNDIRPWSKTSPLRNTLGTAKTCRDSTSSWNNAPSIATWWMFGLTVLIKLSAWTTSGQFWQVREKKVSKKYSPSMFRICSSVSSEAVEGWPPTCRIASTSDVNSWPSGMPAKRTLTSVPTRLMANEGTRSSASALD